jgi:hypothetical protein
LTFPSLRLVSALLSSWVCASAACGTSVQPTPASDEGSADEVDAGSPECLSEGATRACTCASGAQGRKSCKQGAYGACENCVEPRSDAGRKPTTGNAPLCRAGYYAGNLQGKYKPSFTGLGLGAGGIEVELVGQETAGRAPLSLTLEETSSAPAGEFTSYTVGDGCIQGVARSGDTDNPFAARITGDLDCGTGKFAGLLEGYYTLLGLEGLDYTFKGEITGQFELARSELTDGVWTLAEPPALDGSPAGGGSGSWNAVWTAEHAPSATAAVDLCAKIVSTAASDAGASAGADAGTRSGADASP